MVTSHCFTLTKTFYAFLFKLSQFFIDYSITGLKIPEKLWKAIKRIMDTNLEPIASASSTSINEIPGKHTEIISSWARVQDELRHKIVTEDTESWQTDLT